MMDYLLMSQDHIAQVAKIEKECFSSPWSQHSIASELQNPISLWVVAVDDDMVVGYVGSQSVLGEADMMNLAVTSTYRRRGIAKNLITELVRRLSEKNVHSLTLEVRASNHPATELYVRLGFEQVGRRPNYYSVPKEDALILRKEWTV